MMTARRSLYRLNPTAPHADEEELAELGQGLDLAQRSIVFIPVNDAEEFFSGCTHW